MANKLELTWYGKDEPIHIEPRLLIENAALSNTDADPDTENMLIHGDNLLALKALEIRRIIQALHSSITMITLNTAFGLTLFVQGLPSCGICCMKQKAAFG